MTFTPKGVKQFFDWTWTTAKEDRTDAFDADLPDAIRQMYGGKGRKG